MKHIFTKYKLQLIKESSSKYEVNRKIENPSDIDKVVREVMELDKEAEEVLSILALNTKHEVIGIFEVSRGTIDGSLVSVREIFKRLFLVNAKNFVVVHNHPSGCNEPSRDDFSIFNILKTASKVLGITMLDFAIIGNELCSFRDENLYD